MVEPLKQRSDYDCFRTCVAMVTGYDYDVLPPITTVNWSSMFGSSTIRTAGDLRLAGGSVRDLSIKITSNGDILHGLPFTMVARIYRQFFGLRLKMWNRRPPVDGPCLMISPEKAHVVVDVGNGLYIDPAIGWHQTDNPFADDSPFSQIVWVTAWPV